jgi:hypothetical protein
MRNNRVAAFVVLGMYPYNRRLHLLDYAAETATVLEGILNWLTRRAPADILMVNRYALGPQMPALFEKYGFREDRLLGRIDKVRSGEFPLLIRPVKKAFAATDFLLGDVDLREISHWSLKPFCSDYA